MKPLQISSDILPLSKFKSLASQLLGQMKESQRPIIITQNGTPAAVLISPEDFDRWQERERFLSAIQSGLADVEAGRVISDEELEQELEREFGKSE